MVAVPEAVPYTPVPSRPSFVPEPDTGTTCPTALTLSWVPGADVGHVKLSPSWTTVAPGVRLGVAAASVCAEYDALLPSMSPAFVPSLLIATLLYADVNDGYGSDTRRLSCRLCRPFASVYPISRVSLDAPGSAPAGGVT